MQSLLTFPEAGVLDHTQLSQLSGVAIPARRQAILDGHGSSLCILAGLHGYSAERG